MLWFMGAGRGSQANLAKMIWVTFVVAQPHFPLEKEGLVALDEDEKGGSPTANAVVMQRLVCHPEAMQGLPRDGAHHGRS